jgi:hypothetical protein
MSHTRRKQRKVEAVRIEAHFIGGASREEVIAGSAVLAIVLGDDTDRNETLYWCQARLNGDGSCSGFLLTKFGGSGDAYFVGRDLRSCSCPDANYHPDRPAGRLQAPGRPAAGIADRERPQASARPGDRPQNRTRQHLFARTGGAVIARRATGQCRGR